MLRRTLHALVLALAATLALAGCSGATITPRTITLPSVEAAAAEAAAPSSYTATFTPGQTDGLRPVAGTVTFTDAGSGLLRAQGTVSGLEQNQTYVAVAYRDGGCVPTPGVTAYPSGSWRTDATGSASFNVIVNPKGINPVGVVAVGDIHSVSIRQVLVNQITVPGLPISTPAVPNVAAVEACYH